MEYLYIVISAIVILFATYGIFTIIGEMIGNFKISKYANDGVCRCVLFVKNREKDVEYIIRRCMGEIGPFLGGTKASMTIVDMGSTDETQKIITTLAEEYDEIRVKSIKV